MGRSSKKRIDTAAGGEGLGTSAFASLSTSGLPEGPKTPVTPKKAKEKKGPRHVVNVRRLTAGKGGKVVTELTGFEPDFFANRAKVALKDLQKQSGGGGTVKGKAIELQGDCRERIRPYLESKGYRVVLSGG
ncbi:MAG: translation initiation factor [Opitutales bacterium]